MKRDLIGLLAAAVTINCGEQNIQTDETDASPSADAAEPTSLYLAVGNRDERSNSRTRNQLYKAVGTRLELVWTAEEIDHTNAVAWGDFDGDGDPDLAVGGDGSIARNRVYRNDDGALVLAWTADTRMATTGIAWGDFDGDRDLDLGISTLQGIHVYENDNGDFMHVWESDETDVSTSVKWVDYDGDGDMDLSVTNGLVGSIANRIYDNDGGVLTLSWSDTELRNSIALDWGDYDGDGDADMAVANINQEHQVYENRGKGEMSLAWSSPQIDKGYWDYGWDVAWGDFDADGDLDLAVGHRLQPVRVWRNTGTGLEHFFSAEKESDVGAVAWADVDDDGDLDLTIGYSGVSDRGGTIDIYAYDQEQFSLVFQSLDSSPTRSLAWARF